MDKSRFLGALSGLIGITGSDRSVGLNLTLKGSIACPRVMMKSEPRGLTNAREVSTYSCLILLPCAIITGVVLDTFVHIFILLLCALIFNHHGKGITHET